MVQTVTCEQCHAEIAIGSWPFCPHGTPTPSTGFTSYFDIGLGQEVTGWGDIRQAMREHHLDFRDHPSPGEISAQRDKVMARARRR